VEKLLDIDIEDKFKIKEDIILMGIIDIQYYRKIEIGDYVEFKVETDNLTRKIIGIDHYRSSYYLDYDEIETINVGLLIQCENEEELNQILDAKQIRQTAIIYQSKK
jgi:hypothetical protein